MIDLDPGPEVAELRERVAAFIQATVIPAEQRDHSEHGLDESLRAELPGPDIPGELERYVNAGMSPLGFEVAVYVQVGAAVAPIG